MGKSAKTIARIDTLFGDVQDALDKIGASIKQKPVKINVKSSKTFIEKRKDLMKALK